MTQKQGATQRMNLADEVLGPPLARGQANQAAMIVEDQEITFGELNARVNRMGNALKSWLGRGDRAMLMLNDSPDFVAAFFGIIRMGGVAGPMGTRQMPKDLAFSLSDSKAKVLIIEKAFLPIYLEAAKQMQWKLDLVVVRGEAPAGMVSLQDFVRDASPELETAPTAADELAYLMYTSGTTGTPKGSMHAHCGVLDGDQCMEWLGIGPGQRIYSASKMFFAYGMAHALISALRFGATIIPYEPTPDAASLAAIVKRYHPHIVATVPTMYRNLLRDGFAEQPDFKTVRHYLSSGEALPEGIYQRWLETTGVAIYNGLGSTETIWQYMNCRPGKDKAGVSGTPPPYAEVVLRDDAGNLITTPGTRGNAWIKMIAVCHGYLNQPDKTAAAFKDGWFKTGDVLSFDAEGWWYHHGRGDDQLKISGQWVNPSEIEECAISVPGIDDVAAVGAPDVDGLIRMTLFLAAKGGDREAIANAVSEKLHANLPVYKCPRNIKFVETIPRTATGKLQRYELRKKLEKEVAEQLAHTR